MASTIKLQDIVNSARAYPELTPVLGASGWTQEPALTIANDVMQRFLAQSLDWKFNRALAPAFITVSLQQDYITNVTNMGWLESGYKVDINNTVNPKPKFGLEAVRDLGVTSYQSSPFNISQIPNSLATFGTWSANTSYPSGLGQTQTPVSPIQQFVDANGNFLFVSVNGVSGNVQPVLPVNSAAGTTVTDGTVTWKVADPNGVAFRLSPLPAFSGIVWQINPIYQKKPPIFTTLQQLLTPIPDEFGYLFRQGFMALAYEHAGSKKSTESYQKWQEALFTALRSADREREDATLYPSESLMGGGPFKYGMPVGPAWPYDYWNGQ